MLFKIGGQHNSYKKYKKFLHSKLPNWPKSAVNSLNLIFSLKNISPHDLYKMTLLIKVRNNSADEGGKWESYGIAKQSSCGLHFSHFPLFFHNVASSLPIIIPRVGEQVNSNFFYVVYISSKILQLTAGSRDLSQAEKILLLLQTKQLPKWQLFSLKITTQSRDQAVIQRIHVFQVL